MKKEQSKKETRFNKGWKPKKKRTRIRIPIGKPTKVEVPDTSYQRHKEKNRLRRERVNILEMDFAEVEEKVVAIYAMHCDTERRRK